MSSQTANIKLYLIDGEDKVSKQVFNDNTNIIEAKLTELEEGQTENIDALETRVTAAETTITSNTTNIATNTTKISTNTTNIATNTADIEALETRLTTDETNITQNATDIDALETRMTTAETTITTNTANITTNATNITALQESVSALLAKKVEKALVFLSTDYEICYPWAGIATKITISLKSVRTADFQFEVQRQSASDYASQAANWVKIGEQTFNTSAGSVSAEYTISTALSAGDVIRFYTSGDDSDLSVTLFIQND